MPSNHNNFDDCAFRNNPAILNLRVSQTFFEVKESNIFLLCIVTQKHKDCASAVFFMGLGSHAAN